MTTPPTPSRSAATIHEGDYTDDELRKSKPLKRRVVTRIRRNAGLMRWGDVDLVPGSLADDFWNKDMPRLLALAEREVRDGD